MVENLRKLAFAVAALAFLAGCESSGSDGAGSSGSGGAAGAAGAGGAAGGGVVQVTVFHTSDEEGALAPDAVTNPNVVSGGVANFRAWLAAEGYVPAKHLLVSSGDNWTGQAVSTWFEGESTVEIMNLLGYRAAAIGNHEFDFDQSGLSARVAQAAYPYLSANIVEDATGSAPSWAKPYTIVTVDGVDVGFVGLTTTSSSTSAHPKFVQGLSFTDPRAAVEKAGAEARAAGADILLVLAHECIVPTVAALENTEVRLDGILTGHCNEYGVSDVDGIPVVASSHYWWAFTRIDFEYDRESGKVVDTTTKQVDVAYPASGENPVTPDPEVENVVSTWQSKADAELNVPVGYSQSGLTAGTWATANWFTDAWLSQFPSADVALFNFGSLRTPVPSGPFSVGDVVGLAPFKNVLVQVEVTGAELKSLLLASANQNALAGPKAAVGGMKYKNAAGQVEIALDSGAPFDDAATYTVITTDFLYYGGAKYDFASYDPTPTDLGAHMRDPVISWTTALNTSATDPVESHLDATARDQF